MLADDLKMLEKELQAGWCRGRMTQVQEDSTGTVGEAHCLMGAMRVVTNSPATSLGLATVGKKWVGIIPKVPLDNERMVALHNALLTQLQINEQHYAGLGDRHLGNINTTKDLWLWNDTRGSVDAVIELVRDTLTTVEGMGG